MKINYHFILRFFLPAIALTTPIGSASAQSFGIQFQGGGVAMAPTDSAGVIPQTNWNVITGNSFTTAALNDDSGTLVTATLSGAANGTYFSGHCDQTPGDQILTSGELYNGWPGSPTLTINSIPYAQYDLYLYATTDNNSRIETFGVSSGSTYDSSSALFQSMQLTGGTPTWVAATSNWDGTGTAPTVAPGSYAVFTNLTSSDISIAWGANGNGGLNGIQIVSVPIPEPATWIMLVSGIGSLLAFRRRR